MEKNEELLSKVAVLSGEILLKSGAEIFRVEETILYILSSFGKEAEAMVLSTGIFVDIKDKDEKSNTIVKRIMERSTNLYRIYLVNNISRKICKKEIGLTDAYEQLKLIEHAKQYTNLGVELGYISVALFFCVLLSGTFLECLGAGFIGAICGLVIGLSKRWQLNTFCSTVLGSFTIGILAQFISRYILPQMNGDLIIISAIMPLVPGVTFTTAVRDLLNGDYSSGVARMVEAVVTALAVAVGVGTGIALFVRIV